MSGTAEWRDLTIENAEELKGFYSNVMNWVVEEVDIGDYSDFVMKDESGEAVAGICHKSGVNEDFPSQWLIYFTVENIDASIKECKSRGGEALTEIRKNGKDKYCVIRDPAGAVCALYETN